MNSLELEKNAPQGWFSRFDIEVLYPEVAKIPANGVYLEVGVYLGRSLWVARKAAKPSVEVWGIDILEDPKIPKTFFIQVEEGTVAPWVTPIDLLFIDANHGYKECKADIDAYAPYVKKGGAILFHDCDETSPGVVRAVNKFARDTGRDVELFKKPGFNTSIAKVQL